MDRVDAGGVEDGVARGRNRAFRYGCASLLTLLAAMVLCCGMVVAQWPGPSSREVTPTTTPTPIDGSAVLLSDHRTIVYSYSPAVCRLPLLAVTETPTQVTLSLSASEGGQGDCAGFPTPEPLQRGLASPLGTRPLVDRATGMAVPFFDQSHGLRLGIGQNRWDAITFDPRVAISTRAAYFGGPGAATMVQTVYGFNPTGRTLIRGRVQIIQVAGGGWHPPSTTATTPITVRGLAGLAAAGIVVWTESGLTVAVVGGTDDPTSQSTSPPYDTVGTPMSTATLISIASALTGAGS